MSSAASDVYKRQNLHFLGRHRDCSLSLNSNLAGVTGILTQHCPIDKHIQVSKRARVKVGNVVLFVMAKYKKKYEKAKYKVQ